MAFPASRADASEHRALLLKAALDVFQAHGANAPLDLIVQRAGVGRATLYRNFADREQLIWTLLDQALDDVQLEAALVAENETGLFDWLEFMCNSMPRYASLMDHVDTWDAADERLAAIRGRLAEIIDPLLKKAAASNLCTPDLLLMDVLSVCSMLGAVHRTVPVEQRQNAGQRALRLLVRGMLAHPPKTLLPPA